MMGRRRVLHQCLVLRCERQFLPHTQPYVPAAHGPTQGIENQRQVDEALPKPQIRDISAPHFIRHRRLARTHEIRIAREIVGTVRRAPADQTNATVGPELVQEVTQHLAIDGPAFTVQLCRHASLAIIGPADDVLDRQRIVEVKNGEGRHYRVGDLPMSTEENKALVRRLVEIINAQDLDALDTILSPVLAEAWRQIIPDAYKRFAGHHADITDMVAEGHKVVARLATRGSHSGEWEGIPPTGKDWTNTGAFFVDIENGKIVNVDMMFNELGHLKQLGATITPPALRTV
jgi:predicted ester cyclase